VRLPLALPLPVLKGQLPDLRQHAERREERAQLLLARLEEQIAQKKAPRLADQRRVHLLHRRRRGLLAFLPPGATIRRCLADHLVVAVLIGALGAVILLAIEVAVALATGGFFHVATAIAASGPLRLLHLRFGLSLILAVVDVTAATGIQCPRRRPVRVEDFVVVTVIAAVCISSVAAFTVSAVVLSVVVVAFIGTTGCIPGVAITITVIATVVISAFIIVFAVYSGRRSALGSAGIATLSRPLRAYRLDGPIAWALRSGSLVWLRSRASIQRGEKGISAS